MSEMQSRTLLQSATVGRLGCIVNDAPYVVPINFVFDKNYVYSHSLQGTKIEALRGHPRSCLQVDVIHSPLHWSSVIAFGAFKEVTEAYERHQIIRKILGRFPMLTPVESTISMNGGPSEVIVFQIEIDKISGVTEGDDSDFEMLERLGSRTDDF
jgi:nitroimidazol reductase NimA-like FMN-containing flavoprotein (pyridoxamine 5'-phosphate oxidase superfamily)